MRRARAYVLVMTVAVLWGALASTTGTRSLTVTVREAHMRATRSFFGEIRTTLRYGDEVEASETADGWINVRSAAGHEGWIHESALVKGSIAFEAGADDARHGAEASEVALAARGFNKQIEESFKADKNLDYAWIDKMEAAGHDTAELEGFLCEGGLLSTCKEESR